jgi:hypothetical protein
MKHEENKVFPNIDYKKIKVVDPEKQAKFPAIKLARYVVIITIVAASVAYISTSIKAKRAPDVAEIHLMIQEKMKAQGQGGSSGSSQRLPAEQSKSGFLSRY